MHSLFDYLLKAARMDKGCGKSAGQTAHVAGVKTAGARANKAAAQRLGTAAAQSARCAKQNGPGQRSFSIEKATGLADGNARFLFISPGTA